MILIDQTMTPDWSDYDPWSVRQWPLIGQTTTPDRSNNDPFLVKTMPPVPRVPWHTSGLETRRRIWCMTWYVLIGRAGMTLRVILRCIVLTWLRNWRRLRAFWVYNTAYWIKYLESVHKECPRRERTGLKRVGIWRSGSVDIFGNNVRYALSVNVDMYIPECTPKMSWFLQVFFSSLRSLMHVMLNLGIGLSYIVVHNMSENFHRTKLVFIYHVLFTYRPVHRHSANLWPI